MSLFLKIKSAANLRKRLFIENETAVTCTTVRKYFAPQMSITQFNILIQFKSGLGNKKLCNTF